MCPGIERESKGIGSEGKQSFCFPNQTAIFDRMMMNGAPLCCLSFSVFYPTPLGRLSRSELLAFNAARNWKLTEPVCGKFGTGVSISEEKGELASTIR